MQYMTKFSYEQCPGFSLLQQVRNKDQVDNLVISSPLLLA